MNYLLPYNTSHNAYRLLDKELLQSIDKYEMEIIRENSKNAMRFNLGGKPVQLMKRLSSLQNIVRKRSSYLDTAYYMTMLYLHLYAI